MLREEWLYLIKNFWDIKLDYDKFLPTEINKLFFRRD